MLLDKRNDWVVRYPQAVEFAERQEEILWFAKEINVAKDVQEILTTLTEAEKHAVITTLKLFTKYETIIGNEYWKDVVGRLFDSPADIQRMASTFSFTELCVHGPFYNKINAALNLDTEEFYTDYLNDPTLVSRINSLHAPVYSALNYRINNKQSYYETIAKALISLSFAEGVILYSNFAFLKHFQSQGKNKLQNIVGGINFSVRDEALHCEASAWLYKTFCKEYGVDQGVMHNYAVIAAQEVWEHECVIVSKMFELGPIEGITEIQLVRFIESRINLVLRTLGFDNMFIVNYNPIAGPFYKAINSYVSPDFFQRQPNTYVRNWTDNFEWSEQE